MNQLRMKRRINCTDFWPYNEYHLHDIRLVEAIVIATVSDEATG